MRHLKILMWTEVHNACHQNTSTVLEFSNFAMFDQKIVLIFFLKGKKYINTSEIQTHALHIHNQRPNPLRYAVRK